MSGSHSAESWGRYPNVKQSIQTWSWPCETPTSLNQSCVLAYGAGRSYGDSCLNDGATVISTTQLNRFIGFDSNLGRLRAESGVTLAQILEFFVPLGWFLPVTPGTKFVTLGGAIANDIHGKNHHTAGTFGNFVEQFELVRSNGQRLICSRNQNQDLFNATIGGLGLTGLIAWVELRLKKVSGPLIDNQSIKFANIDEFFEISANSDKEFEYTVAWIDCLTRGNSLGRGLFMRGNHSAKSAPGNFKKPLLSVPFNAPNFLLNKLSIKAFNFLYYNRQQEKQRVSECHYDPFFYPLDALDKWNRIYGKRGFFQFQCVVPSQAAIKEILRIIADSGQGSFLAVLKEFGDVRSDGLLSFPRRGFTLALDFPNRGLNTLQLLGKLEQVVVEAKGAIYPAKDACMSAQSFQRFYPNLARFKQFIDPHFSSSFWRRVTGETICKT